MNLSQILFLSVVFVVVAGLAAVVLLLLRPEPLRRRVAGLQPQHGADRGHVWMARVVKAAAPLVKMSVPEEGWDKSPLRVRFMNAGWRGPAARTVFFAAKTCLTLGLPLLAALALARLHRTGEHLMLVLVLCAGAGYYLPNVVLESARRRRQREIAENFPDALDLLTVCVEAGLSLDTALVRVAAEIDLKSVALAEELNLVLMEMRAGFSKEKALRNLALRCGIDEVDMLVAMLIQAERFGTGMGASLRVHADNLRTKRRQRAEEAAAKVALKLLFPLTFCIFPVLLVVLLGPAYIQIRRFLLPTLMGTA